MHGIVSTAFWGLLTSRFDRGRRHGYAKSMLRTVRLFWICLLVMAMPFKAMALAGGMHCGAANAVSGVPMAAMPMSDSDAETCPHHEKGTTDATNAAEASPADATSQHDGSHHGQHSCSVCAHCGGVTTLPSVWTSPVLNALPHTVPASPTGTWRSATVRHLDRPPTHGVI